MFVFFKLNTIYKATVLIFFLNFIKKIYFMFYRIKQASRKIYLYNRADMPGLRDHMSQFKESYLSEDLSHMSVK